MLLLDNYIMDDYFYQDENDADSSQEDTSPEDTPKEEAVESKEDTSPEETPKEEPAESKEDDAGAEETPKEEPAESKEEDAGTEETPKEEAYLPFLIGRKVGMTQLFSEDGTSFPATVIEAGPCTVLQIKNVKNDGYSSVQLGFLDKKESKTNKALLGHFNKSKSKPKSYLKEFRSSADIENLSLGDSVTVNQFNEGDFITVSGISKGKGFAGHMKRHGFGGGRASHGKNSVMRKSGSVGAGTSPGRIFPGMKMAGRMGNQKTSIKNLSILNIDREKNLIFVNGSVPGANNNIIYLTKS